MSRYDRLLELSTFSNKKLELLRSKKIFLFGAGGVGQHIATYLITNGVINLDIIDFDKIELSNLNRQILLKEKDVGKLKVDVVRDRLIEKNSEAQIRVYNTRIDATNINRFHAEDYDVIIDAVDNWETKFVISKFAHDNNIPFLHVGVDGTGGQFCIFKKSCLQDLFVNSILKEKREGVMGPMVGLLSSIACLHLLRYLSGEDVELDTLYSFDQSTNLISKIQIK